jgi:ribosomal protein S1
MAVEPRHTPLQDDLSRAEALLTSGETVELEVTGLNRGGLLVRFGDIGGFIPNSQLPASSGQDLAASKKTWVGSRLTLRVIEVDPRRPSVIFAADDAPAPEPPPEHLSYTSGEIVSGVVQEIFEDGVLLQLEGACGLIAKSDLAWRWLDHPGDFVNPGDLLEARVLGSGDDRADLRLSRKDLVANPWQIFGHIHKAGDLVLGTILQIRRTGLLVRLVPGVRGLVHRKDIDTPQVMQLDQIVSPGDKVTVRIAEFNPKKEHIRLKMWWAPK